MIGKPYFNVNEKVSWYYLTMNPNAIPIFEQNMDKVFIYFDHLCRNPNAIHIIEKYNYQIIYLSENPNAIHLLEKHINNKSYISRFIE